MEGVVSEKVRQQWQQTSQASLLCSFVCGEQTKHTSKVVWGLRYCTLEAIAQGFLCSVYSEPRKNFIYVHNWMLATLLVHMNSKASQQQEQPAAGPTLLKKKKGHAMFLLGAQNLNNSEWPKPTSHVCLLRCFTQQRVQHKDSNKEATIYNIHTHKKNRKDAKKTKH